MEEWITQLYKSKGGFGKSTLENRRSTAVEKRRDYRNSVLTKLRQIPQNMSPLQVTRDVELPQEKPEEKKSRRLEMLEKWKMEKERKKLEAQKNKKPIFKVCRVESNGNFDELYNFIKGKKIVKGKSQFPTHNDGGARHSRSISSHQVLKNDSVQKDVKSLQNKGLSKKTNVKVNCKSTKPATIISNQPTSRAPHSSERPCENQQGTSNGRNVSSNERNVLSNGRNVLSNGRNVLSNGRNVSSNRKNVSKKAKADSNDTKVNSVEAGEMNNISLDRKLTKQSCDSEASTSRSGGLNISTSEQTKMENNKSSRVSLGKSMLHDSENQVDESSRTICDNDYTLQIESLDTASVRTERKSLRITLQKVNVDKTIATENKQIEGNSSTDLDATGRHLDESEILKNKGTPNRHNSEYIPQCYVPLTPLSANRCFMESTPLLYDSKKGKTSRITPKNRRETFSFGEGF